MQTSVVPENLPAPVNGPLHLREITTSNSRLSPFARSVVRIQSRNLGWCRVKCQGYSRSM
jgi:hypothetical protein